MYKSNHPQVLESTGTDHFFMDKDYEKKKYFAHKHGAVMLGSINGTEIRTRRYGIYSEKYSGV